MLRVVKAAIRGVLRPLGYQIVKLSPPSPQLDDYQKKLLDVGAIFLPNGDIEVQNVRFHTSYPTFKQVLVENCYFENYNFALRGSWVVFDIGANAGASCLWLARLRNVKKVYAFEPVAPTYQMLVDNLALNPSLKDKIETFSIGLGATKQTLQIPLHADHVMSASSKGTFNECFVPESIETIQIEPADSTLGALLAAHATDHVFLKIDCEGSGI